MVCEGARLWFGACSSTSYSESVSESIYIYFFQLMSSKPMTMDTCTCILQVVLELQRMQLMTTHAYGRLHLNQANDISVTVNPRYNRLIGGEFSPL